MSSAVGADASTTTGATPNFTYGGVALARVDASRVVSVGSDLNALASGEASVLHEWAGPLIGGSLPSAVVSIATEAEPSAAVDATPAGRPYSAHYLTDTGPVRNIPGSVVDETIDYGNIAKDLPDRTVYYDANNDVTVVESKTIGMPRATDQPCRAPRQAGHWARLDRSLRSR
jgi:hypothetical protein